VIDLALILGNTGGDQISAGAVTGIISAIFAGLGLLAGKFIEKKKQSNEITVKDQPIGVVKHQPLVTWADHAGLVRRVDRIDTHLDQLRKDSHDQFKGLIESAANRESRIIDKIDDVARAIHARIDNWKGGAK
jgi:hypothetical protein